MDPNFAEPETPEPNVLEYDTSLLNPHLGAKVRAAVALLRKSPKYRDVERAHRAQKVDHVVFFSDPQAEFVHPDRRASLAKEAAATIKKDWNGRPTKFIYLSETRGSHAKSDYGFGFEPSRRTPNNAPSDKWLDSYSLTLDDYLNNTPAYEGAVSSYLMGTGWPKPKIIPKYLEHTIPHEMTHWHSPQMKDLEELRGDTDEADEEIHRLREAVVDDRARDILKELGINPGPFTPFSPGSGASHLSFALGDRIEDIDPEGPWSERTEILRRYPRCFSSGTFVTLYDGSKRAIEAIRCGDDVLAFDAVGALHSGRVTRLIRDITTEWIELENGTRVSPGHRYLRPDGSFLAIAEILASDGLVIDEHGKAKIITGRLIRAVDAGSDAQ